MRIAFLVSRFPALSETFILNQITGLLERGHDVQIFAMRPGEAAPHHPDVDRYRLLERTHYPPAMPANTLRRLGRAGRLLLRHSGRARSILLRSLNLFRLGRTAASLKLFYAAIPWLELDAPCEVVHCHFGPNGNLAVLLRDIGALQARILTTFHGADIRLGLREGPRVYAPLRRGGDCILSISAYNRRHLEEFGFDPAKIRHHPVGISLQRFPLRTKPPAGPADRRRPVRILTVARLVEDKGIEYGLRALAALLRRQPGLEVEYRLVGDGPLRGALEALVRELGLEGRVCFAGARNQDEVAGELCAADLFLLPSVAEALPVVLMEAGAVGLPVVCTDVGSVRELVAEGTSGFVVPPRDVEQMASALARLLQDPAAWPAFGRAGRAQIERHYDIEKLNDRLAALCHELVAATPARPGIVHTSHAR